MACVSKGEENFEHEQSSALSEQAITLCNQFKLFIPLFFQPSSCLSDREEDEIYGFGYGVFGPRAGRSNPQPSTSTSQFQMAQQQQQQQSLPNNPTNVPVTQQQKYVLSIEIFPQFN